MNIRNPLSPFSNSRDCLLSISAKIKVIKAARSKFDSSELTETYSRKQFYLSRSETENKRSRTYFLTLKINCAHREDVTERVRMRTDI